MSNTSKARGSRFESDFVKHMRGLGYDVERLRQSGARDEGDAVWRNGGIPVVFELKATKAVNMTDFVRQAETEAFNYAKSRHIEVPFFAVLVKKRNAPMREAFVILPLYEYLRQVGAPF